MEFKKKDDVVIGNVVSTLNWIRPVLRRLMGISIAIGRIQIKVLTTLAFFFL